MKFAVLTIGLLFSATSFAGETTVTESRTIMKFGELEAGDVVRIKTGLRLVSAHKIDYDVTATQNSCTYTMRSPIRGGEAFFESDSDWKVKDTYSFGQQSYQIMLENVDMTSQRPIRVSCPQSMLVKVELEKAGMEIVTANRPINVLRMGRPKPKVDKVSEATDERSGMLKAYDAIHFGGGL
jgi:hypothetical protein